jgi:hypothetical protein
MITLTNMIFLIYFNFIEFVHAQVLTRVKYSIRLTQHARYVTCLRRACLVFLIFNMLKHVRSNT